MNKNTLDTDIFKIDKTNYYIKIEDLSGLNNCINLYQESELVYSSGMCHSYFSSFDEITNHLLCLDNDEQINIFWHYSIMGMLCHLNNSLGGILSYIIQNSDQLSDLQEFIYNEYNKKLKSVNQIDVLNILSRISPSYNLTYDYNYLSTLKSDTYYFHTKKKGLFCHISVSVYKGLIKIVDLKNALSVYVPYIPLNTKSLKSSLNLGFYIMTYKSSKKQFSTSLCSKAKSRECVTLCNKLYVKAYKYMTECIDYTIRFKHFEADDKYGIYFGPTGIKHEDPYWDYVRLCNSYSI